MQRQRRQGQTAELRSRLMTHKTNSAKRLHKDLQELRNSTIPLVGITAAPLNDDLYTWHGNLRPASDSPYKGGVFHFEMVFPQNYPIDPPSLTLFNCDIKHPNIFGNKLCLDMLEKNPKGAWYEGWNPCYTVEGILVQLQSFLFNHYTQSGSYLKLDSDIKKIVEHANSYKCLRSGHKGSLQPWPKFNDNDKSIKEFIMVQTPEELLAEELMCYMTRDNLKAGSLGIGVSVTKLPRTGEIRTVKPSLDLLSLKAFTKQNIRKSMDGEKFTHWLPLYFGESEPYEKKDQIWDDKKEEYKEVVRKIDPRERCIHLLKKAMCYLTKKDTRMPFTANMVVEAMPRLMTTLLVDLVEQKHHFSLVAIRRLFNFIRLFRLLFELAPEAEKMVDDRLKEFMDHPEKRVKEYCSSLGDILSFAIVSQKYNLEDVLDAYLEEQLDRQAFWILKQIPELDHTDEKYKGKNLVMETERNEVCFKTGLTGFNITMTFFTINKMLNDTFKGDLKAACAAMDANSGCLPLKVETAFQKQCKKMDEVDNFNKYYTWVNRKCADNKAMGERLKQAVTNSKAKKYHGSSEHMNELPALNVQATTHLEAEPSPFKHFDKSKGSYSLDEKSPQWRNYVIEKFQWVKTYLNNPNVVDSAATIAVESDRREMYGREQHRLESALKYKQNDLKLKQYRRDLIGAETCYEDYPKNKFTWKHVFHKLCFEQMLDNLAYTQDFKLLYSYIEAHQDSIEVLRIPTLDKTKLKSNHYWLMVVVSRMRALKVVKFSQTPGTVDLGTDGFKFLKKGFEYLVKNGRELNKMEFRHVLKHGRSADYLYPCLKLQPSLQVLKFVNCQLSNQETKAVGKVLADFKQIKELDLTNSALNTTTTKDIADGLMRAKQLEILKVGENPSMGASVNTIIYNLAFSPKIRHIDLTQIPSTTDTAEALFKLLNISGSVENLILFNSDVCSKLGEQFWQAVGQNKTLKHLDLGLNHQTPGNAQLCGKAIAMNAKKNGSLVSMRLDNWMTNNTRLNQFLEGLRITEQEHELWYGDKNIANKMVKEDVYNKVMHFKLQFLSIGGDKTNLAGQNFKPKLIKAQIKPEWPRLIELASKCKGLIFGMMKAKFNAKDMELLAYMIGDNPMGACQITSLDIMKCPIGKEGAKFLAPALKVNKSLITLDLSSCKLGVSGMYALSDALTDNDTLKSLNLYRNILDVDGARSIGKMLAKNKSLEFLDLGHNRVRDTGLKAICAGVAQNANSKLNQLGLCADFISDKGLEQLFEELVFKKKQLTQLFIKKNFISEPCKVALYNKCIEKKVNLFVDDFRIADLLVKEKFEKSIWISPIVPTETITGIKKVLYTNEIGFVTDIRISQGNAVPGRPNQNFYATVEFLDANSLNRSLQLASKKRAIFSGTKVRIYRSGTQTAIIQPKQKRR